MSTVIHQVLHLTYNHRKYLEHKLVEEAKELDPSKREHYLILNYISLTGFYLTLN